MSLREELADLHKAIEQGYCIYQDSSYPCPEVVDCAVCAVTKSFALFDKAVEGIENPHVDKDAKEMGWPDSPYEECWNLAIRAVLELLEEEKDDLPVSEM